MTGPGQLQLQQQPIPVPDRTVSDTAEEPQQNILSIQYLQGLPVQEINRERFPALRKGRMLSSQLGKARLNGTSEKEPFSTPKTGEGKSRSGASKYFIKSKKSV